MRMSSSGMSGPRCYGLVAGLIVGFSVAAAVAAQSAGAKSPSAAAGAATTTPDHERVRVFPLQHVESREAQDVIVQLLGRGRDASVVANARTNSLVVRSTGAILQEIELLINTLDVPTQDRRQEGTQTKIFALKNMKLNNSVTEQLRVALSDQGRMAVDPARNCVVVQDTASSLVKFANLLAELEGHPSEKATPAVLQIRVVWLINGLDRPEPVPVPADLNRLVAALADVGIEGLQLAAQTVIHTVANDQFMVECTPELDSPCNLRILGKFVDTEGASAGLQIGVTVDEQRAEGRRQWCELNTKVIAPPGQTIVLGSAPVGKMTSVFVLQVTAKD